MSKSAQSYSSSLSQPWSRWSWPVKRSTARTSKTIKLSLAILALFGVHHFQQAVSVSREALRDKYAPTVYSDLMVPLSKGSNDTQWMGNPASDIRHGSYSRGELWAQRSAWKKLGFGFEGDTFIHDGSVVVKMYKTANAPFRDCMPEGDHSQRWPTEIQASLLLGGMAEPDSLNTSATFLPVVDYFLAPDKPGREPKWHLVTPFLPSGNLKKLARQLREADNAYTAHDVDVLFRPSLEQVLGGLYAMHNEHRLCHDDIKFDNILTAPGNTSSMSNPEPEAQTHWMLADMGNVREVSHAYHSSALWSVMNNNLPDCRSNDVYRLLKTYMRFLRSSVDDVDVFDVEFLDGNEPWSQLFWTTYQEVMEGRSLIALKTQLQSQLQFKPAKWTRANGDPTPSESASVGSSSRPVTGHPGARAQVVLDMTKVSASEAKVRAWAFTWILGVPVTECSAMQDDQAPLLSRRALSLPSASSRKGTSLLLSSFLFVWIPIIFC
jgi:hypothetical protein